MLTALSIIVAAIGWLSRISDYLSNPLTMVNGYLLIPVVAFGIEFLWHFACYPRTQPAPTPTPSNEQLDEFNMRRHSAPYSSRPR